MTFPTIPARRDNTWINNALCRTAHNPDLWTPDDYRNPNIIASAKRVCARCLVRVECLNEALAIGDEHGIYGGTTPIERQSMKQGAAP